ncbi:hypothetical protein O181_003047 [Austropuccinia psidii MF-1]|uniref:Integrase catalytic domain-containing protein n=1 Tax=Austropuccinia psidii MF-1 TaxID=1389203 RepID=A0A9Q3GEJ1_9BASI|nr:hypothetical protein [Austropuccinia psidii MF-1]
MIQKLEDMIRSVFAHVLEFKDSDIFTHDWCTFIPQLELGYKTSIHASTGKIPEMLEKGWNPKLPVDTLKKYLLDIHPTASRFKLLLDKVRHDVNKRMNYAFECAKKKWDKRHKATGVRLGDLILVSTLKFNNIRRPKKFKDSFAGPFIIEALHGKMQYKYNCQVNWKKHPTFPVSLVNNYSLSDKESFL